MLLLMFSDYGPHSLYTYTCSVTGVTATHTHTHTFLCSERATATGAEGERLKEGGSINKSLVCLGTVISSLGELALWLTGSNNKGDNLHLSLGHYLQHYQNCSVHRIIIHVNYVLVKPWMLQNLLLVSIVFLKYKCSTLYLFRPLSWDVQSQSQEAIHSIPRLSPHLAAQG